MNMDDTNIILPDNVLEPLCVASGTSVLKKALECLIETAKTSDGRLVLASKNIILSVFELCQYYSSKHCSPDLLAVKLLRNLCAGEIKNQNLFIEHGGVKILSRIVSSLGLVHGSDNGILSMVLQVLGNISLAGEQHRSFIWLEFFPHRFLDIAKVRSKETCDPLCMIICTCSEDSRERTAEIFSEPGQQIIVQIIQTVTIAGFRQDWVKSLVSNICVEEPYFSLIFSKLSRAVEAGNPEQNASSQTNHFGDEKAFLMSIISEIINERVGHNVVSNEFSLCIFEILRNAISFVDFSTRLKLPLPTGFPRIDVIGYTLSILRDISACDRRISNQSEKQDNVDVLIGAGMIKFLINLLHDLEPPEMIRKAMVNSDAENKTTSQRYKYCPYRGFRRDIVAVIGNCSYHRKQVQDEIREENGILVLLQQCVNDEDNLFLREWGYWAMGNIFEWNMENQQLVANLELQKSLDIPEIAGMGLRVEVDPETRRPKLVNA